MDQLENKKYDLAERTSVFAENLIEFSKSLEVNKIAQVIILQLVRSGTSMGANYMEATNGSSKKDFVNKIYICKKEAQETKHWLRMLATCRPDRRDDLRKLWKEVQELTLIFQKITSTLRSKVTEN